MEANGPGIDGGVVQTSDLLQGLETWEGAVLEPRQTVHQPAAVDPLKRSHVRDGADAEEVQRHGQGLRGATGLGEGPGQDIGDADAGQPPVGRTLGGAVGVEQGAQGWPLLRDGVVIGDDHLQTELLGALEGLPGRHSVVDGDQQPDSVVRELLHHGDIQAIAIGLAAGDGRLGLGPQLLQNADQERRAGHAIGVVVAADRQAFVGFAGLLEALDRQA